MQVNVALVSLDPTVGALHANADLIVAAYMDAVAQGADIVLTPEMSLAGYPLQDMTQRPGFLRDVEAERMDVMRRIKASGAKAAIVFGHPTDTGTNDGNRRLVYNSATFYDPVEDVEQVIHKTELPNYGVFDEMRNYLAGPQNRVIHYRGLRLGLMICEDGWLPGVVDTLASQGADLLLWVNGSPFSKGKNVKRHVHASNRIARAQVPIAYVNLVGCQDELVFDGQCFSWDGASYVATPLFQETVQVVTFDVERGQAWTRKAARGPMAGIPVMSPTATGEIYQAKVRAMRDYAHKTGFAKVVLGMSGGIDSAIVASICTDALGPENVLLVRLPSSFSSSGSLTDAAEARDLLGCPMRTIAIEPTVNALRSAYAGAQYDTGPIPGTEPRLTGVADENAQARVRGDLLMGIANQEGYLLVTTGNRSEVSVGYFTLYGDSCGGFNLLKDTYKTDVSVAAGRNALTGEDVERLTAEFGPGLVQWRNGLGQAEIDQYGFMGPAGRTVPLSIEAKAESAELAENQKDSNSLPLYPILDGIITCLVDRNMGIDEIMNYDRSDPEMREIMSRTRIAATDSIDEAVERGFQEDQVRRVNRLINNAEHKRRQTAPGPKVGDMLYGQDRRMPIINGYTG